jgi:hypothetical protein
MNVSTQNQPVPKEVQVYKNDFFSGLVLLTKKLLML